ncbi:MAG TPA: glycoside hydrolase family 5 protein [Fibrobacteria bacterium]|nr:glycoside hydrolase family 5 protein [Fibrobacteria bacterium]
MKLHHLLVGTILATGLSAQAKTPVATYGHLWAKGGTLYDSSKTNKVTLRGMSMYWSSEPDGYAFFNGGVVRWLQSDWQLSVIRVPLAVNPVPNGGNKSIGYLQDSATNMSRVQIMVSTAIQQGLYVIVDWHVIDAGSSNSTNPQQSSAISFFRTLATQYKNVPNVLWEIWNEPTTDNGTVANYANAIIPVIRNAGNTNLVIIGSSGWSSQPNSVSGVTDPANNVAYTLHFYANSHPPSGPYWSNAQAAQSAGKTVFVTEWGTTNADGNSGYNWSASQSWLDELEAAGISWCNWDVGTQRSVPSDESSAVQGTAAVIATASTTGNWASSDLSAGGAAVRSYIIGKQGGKFTGPDTTLTVVQPLTVTPTTGQLAGGGVTPNFHFAATFSHTFTWTMQIAQPSTGASYSYSQNNDSINQDWNSSIRRLATQFGAGTVNVTVTGGPWTTAPANLTASFTLTPSTSGIQVVRLGTALAWTASGLRLPAGMASSGEAYRVRILDMSGRQQGEARTVLAQSSPDGVVLDIHRPTGGAGVEFLELVDGAGQRSQVLLPPIR